MGNAENALAQSIIHMTPSPLPKKRANHHNHGKMVTTTLKSFPCPHKHSLPSHSIPFHSMLSLSHTHTHMHDYCGRLCVSVCVFGCFLSVCLSLSLCVSVRVRVRVRGEEKIFPFFLLFGTINNDHLRLICHTHFYKSLSLSLFYCHFKKKRLFSSNNSSSPPSKR